MVSRSTEMPPWWDLASEALSASVHGELDRLGDLLTQIGEQFSHDWAEILFTMIDTMMATQGIERSMYGPKLRQIADTDGVPESHDVLDAISWSSAVIQARATDDRAAYADLMHQVKDSEQAALYVGNLVASLGITIRAVTTGVLDRRPRPVREQGTDEGHNHG